MKLWNKISNFFLIFLGQLKKAGKESFGTSAPGCCKPNRQNPARKI
jgi:hypothetical protein